MVELLQPKGLLLIADSAIIAAPSSAKSREHQRAVAARKKEYRRFSLRAVRDRPRIHKSGIPHAVCRIRPMACSFMPLGVALKKKIPYYAISPRQDLPCEFRFSPDIHPI